MSRTQKYDSGLTSICKDLHWLPVEYRIPFKILLIKYKAIHGLKLAPDYLAELISTKPTYTWGLRSDCLCWWHSSLSRRHLVQDPSCMQHLFFGIACHYLFIWALQWTSSKVAWRHCYMTWHFPRLMWLYVLYICHCIVSSSCYTGTRIIVCMYVRCHWTVCDIGVL